MVWQKGQSGNPGGRPKRTASELDLIEKAQALAPEALDVIREIMTEGDTQRVRLSAAIALLERAYGAAKVASQPTEEDHDPPTAIPVTRVDSSIPEPG